MKLVRWGPVGAEKPGILDGRGQIRDLSIAIPDIDGANLSEQTLDRLRAMYLTQLPVVPADTRIGPCIGSVGKIICVGLNYADHAEEAGMEVPPEPVMFFKATTAICGPNDPIVLPRGATKVDWEVELGVVIGREARYVPEDQALSHVAGYCAANDLTERVWQFERAGQWVKGKSADTFAPLGPWLVTADEIPDPQNLKLWLDVDGVRRQDGCSKTMVYPVAHLVSYISGFMTLMPGDVILTGSPPGVGMGAKPPVYLQEGQTVELGVEGLGQQKMTVQAAG